jgi:hypothetical protein
MPNKNKEILKNGVKLAGETLLIPGSSLLLDGKIKYGMFHAGIGILAKMTLGIPGVILVAANSFCLSLTKKNLVSAIFGSNDYRNIKLIDRVNLNIDKGLSLKEIQEDVFEDVEDIYMEVKTKQQPEEKKSK